MEEYKDFIDRTLERLKKCTTERQAKSLLKKVYSKGFDVGFSMNNSFFGRGF